MIICNGKDNNNNYSFCSYYNYKKNILAVICPLSNTKEYGIYLLNETYASHNGGIFFCSHFLARGKATITRKSKTSGARSCNSMIMCSQVNSLSSYWMRTSTYIVALKNVNKHQKLWHMKTVCLIFLLIPLAYIVDQENPCGPAKQPMNMVLTLEFEPRPHWWESSAPATVPLLPPCNKNVLHQLFFVKFNFNFSFKF